MADIEVKKEELQSMIDAMPITEVARKLGVSTQTVYNLIRRHGLNKPDRTTRVVVLD